MAVEVIDYEVNGLSCEGRLVYSNSRANPLPGLILCPNWMGVTEEAVTRANAFAARGHVVFVVDIYGKAFRPSDHGEAAGLANPLRENPAEVRLRMLGAAGLRAGRRQTRAASPGMRAALGFCFGAGNALELARAGPPINAAIAIHGDLSTSMPAAPGAMKAAILSLQGAPDPIISGGQRTGFEAEMQASGAFWQGVLFGNALHAYTDAGIDIRASRSTTGTRQTTLTFWSTGFWPTRTKAVSRPANSSPERASLIVLK